MTDEQAINVLIKSCQADTNFISDGYHTFAELYDHRISLFIALCYMLHTYEPQKHQIWKTIKHDNGEVWEGWFIMGIDVAAGHQISYHLPINRWDEVWFAPEIPCTPTWDGHQSSEVLERIKKMYQK